MPQPDFERNIAAIKDMVALKRQKVGVKYTLFLDAVTSVLRTNYPDAFGMPDEQLRDLIATVDIVGEESHSLLKRLSHYCTGCGWCCSRTSKIVVSREEAERVSRELKRRTDVFFRFDGKEWTIKNGHPCQWWNPRNGRCTIYNIRPETCRQWPLAINEIGQKMLHPNAECSFAVMVLADKVVRFMTSPARP